MLSYSRVKFHIMRVVSGLYRHRELKSPSNGDIRPTKDMVKEAIFSAISNTILNSTVLDLFAGSGALGIEAISRGAKFAYFNDINIDAFKLIKTNLDNLSISNYQLDKSDYLDALANYKRANIKFDIVLLDPPYKNNVYQIVLDILLKDNLLSDKAVIILESDNKLSIENNFKKIKDYKYGKTFVKILWK